MTTRRMRIGRWRMTKPFTLLLLLTLALSLLDLRASRGLPPGEGVEKLTRTLLGLCACVYLYRRVPVLGLVGILALLVLQAYVTGQALGGLFGPEIDPSPLLGA